MAIVRLHWYSKLFDDELGDVTASLGDPMWRKSDRRGIKDDSIKKNSQNIESQLRSISKSMLSRIKKLGFELHCRSDLQIVRNSEWLSSLTAAEFFVQYGKLFQAKELLSREGFLRCIILGWSGELHQIRDSLLPNFLIRFSRRLTF